jgi:phage anti-repressor protein
MAEYIYLLQTREFINSKQNIYKIGKTTQPNLTRFNSYPNGSKLLIQMVCNDCDMAEKEILRLFRKKYTERKEFGNEYFEGDYSNMIDDIYQKLRNITIIHKGCQTGEESVNDINSDVAEENNTENDDEEIIHETNKDVREILKKHITIDPDFIDTFFKRFKFGKESSFDIQDIDVVNYLDISMRTLRKRLNNVFSKNKTFIENVNYIKIKNTDTSAGVTYMLNYDCFEKLAMLGKTEQSETVRRYFIKLRQFLILNQHLICQDMKEKKNLDFKKYDISSCLLYI